jgi:lipopolysaccharide biosynthesis regulator YciM
MVKMLILAVAMTPFMAAADETPVADTPAAETVNEPTPEDEEAQARLRQELEQREAEKAQARRQNCEQARAQLAQVVDMPPRNVRQTLEDGTISRMTEEEHKAYVEKLRAVEAQDCD